MVFFWVDFELSQHLINSVVGGDLTHKSMNEEMEICLTEMSKTME